MTIRMLAILLSCPIILLICAYFSEASKIKFDHRVSQIAVFVFGGLLVAYDGYILGPMLLAPSQAEGLDPFAFIFLVVYYGPQTIGPTVIGCGIVLALRGWKRLAANKRSEQADFTK